MRFSTAAYALFALTAGASAAVLPRVGDGTFFAPGLGACGKSNGPNDLIVAVPESIFNSFGFTSPGNPNTAKVCGKTITAQHAGKSVKVRVVDRCGGCKANDLDFSPAAFNKLDVPAKGRININWKFD